MTIRTFTITVATRVENPRPTTTGVEGGVDYDAELTLTHESGATSQWRGEVTYAPAQYDGRLIPCGPPVDRWMSDSLTRALREPRIARHRKLLEAITESLGSGEGIKSSDVSIDRVLPAEWSPEWSPERTFMGTPKKFMKDFQIGDRVVLARPWYCRGRVHTVTAIDGRYATVNRGNKYTGVGVDDLRHAEGAELLVTPYELTDDQIAAYARDLHQDPLAPESRARRDCLTATRCLNEALRLAAKARIARAINDRILHGTP